MKKLLFIVLLFSNVFSKVDVNFTFKGFDKNVHRKFSIKEKDNLSFTSGNLKFNVSCEGDCLKDNQLVLNVEVTDFDKNIILKPRIITTIGTESIVESITGKNKAEITVGTSYN